MKRGNDGRLELPPHAVGQRLHELNLNEQHAIEVEAQTAIDDIDGFRVRCSCRAGTRRVHASVEAAQRSMRSHLNDIERAKALDVERPEWRGAFA